MLDIARRHDLLVLADEIYDKILYDGAVHDMRGRARPGPAGADAWAGCRRRTGRPVSAPAGWRSAASTGHDNEYLEGLQLLANMRLCPNVPAQHAIQTALGGFQSINALIRPGGRLYEQRNHAWQQAHRHPRRRLRQAGGRALPVRPPRPGASTRSATTSG